MKAIGRMHFPVRRNQLTSQAKAALERFEKQHIPFAVVVLCLRLPQTGKNLDEMIADNFRREKDVIIKEASDHIVLMPETTLEAAERAVIRLKDRLAVLFLGERQLNDWEKMCAFAHILGCCNATHAVESRYIDLRPSFGLHRRSNHTMEFRFATYVRWLESLKNTSAQGHQTINIVV